MKKNFKSAKHTRFESRSLNQADQTDIQASVVPLHLVASIPVSDLALDSVADSAGQMLQESLPLSVLVQPALPETLVDSQEELKPESASESATQTVIQTETVQQWQTLYVFFLSLCLIFWIRKDSLEQYWQQTRHQPLGLATLIDHPFWQSGVELSKKFETLLDSEFKVRAEMQDRLILTANILFYGREFLTQENTAEAQPAETKISQRSQFSAGKQQLNRHDNPAGLPETENSALTDLAMLKNSSLKLTEVKHLSPLSTANQANPVNPAASVRQTDTTVNPPVVPASEKTSESSSQLVEATQISQAGLSAELQATAVPLAEFAPLSLEGRIVLKQNDKVLLVGDSMMQGIAPHLARSLQNAQVRTLDLSKPSTGLTYPSYFDWPAVIQKTIEKEKISVLVVLLGANDTWDMILGGRYEPFGSAKWQSMYSARIERILALAHTRHIRVVWLGAPNMGKEKINKGVQILNQLYAQAFVQGPSRFLSTRESLSDDVNLYNRAITKADGKTMVVRTEDGIHFTRDGHTILRDLILRQLVLPAVVSSNSPASAVSSTVPGTVSNAVPKSALNSMQNSTQGSNLSSATNSSVNSALKSTNNSSANSSLKSSVNPTVNAATNSVPHPVSNPAANSSSPAVLTNTVKPL